ncbi:hypothetical protein EAS62_20220 [Bradyrhizobium zhanjiangense]|uniref:DUF3631 domain-containing protein n=1 Tax=Bradyrhizobium zhanjiangense TaxID=1325107 RepID=A0ABY0DJS3_9BRAD|nr:hypothetical protein EAS62_20220 [Bradyrhizobium zhanjiangense]
MLPRTGPDEGVVAVSRADDNSGRDEVAREQPKWRAKARGSIVTLEQLPLFADERALSDAILGHGSYTHWRAIVPLLERRGFPKVDGLMGGRYTRAVRAFFDREYGIHGATQVSEPHQPADLGAWKRERAARRQERAALRKAAAKPGIPARPTLDDPAAKPSRTGEADREAEGGL